MSKFVSFDELKTNFDGVMRRMGYIRIKEKCEDWGITAENFRTQTKGGWYKEDSFIVNGVKYISKNAKSPAEARKELENG